MISLAAITPLISFRCHFAIIYHIYAISLLFHYAIFIISLSPLLPLLTRHYAVLWLLLPLSHYYDYCWWLYAITPHYWWHFQIWWLSSIRRLLIFHYAAFATLIFSFHFAFRHWWYYYWLLLLLIRHIHYCHFIFIYYFIEYYWLFSTLIVYISLHFHWLIVTITLFHYIDIIDDYLYYIYITLIRADMPGITISLLMT